MARAGAVEIEPLPVLRAADVKPDVGRPRWLVDGLWAAEGVGIVGGAPKCCKTWLALDLAVSVASGTAALGRFPVNSAGPVLLFGAEDAAVRLRERIEAIAAARDITIGSLDVHLIVTPGLRLDVDAIARDSGGPSTITARGSWSSIRSSDSTASTRTRPPK